MESDQMESRVRLMRSLSSGIISCLSVRRKDSQGCTADVKDTPPSPKEKPDDLIGPDINPVGDHDDLRAKGSRLSIESFDSGVSFKSDWSKGEPIHFKEGVSPSRLDLSSFEKKHDVSDDGFSESPDDLMAMGRTLSEPAKSVFHIPLRQQSHLMMAHRSLKAFGSSLSLMNDSFICPRQDSLPSVLITRRATGIPQSEPVKIDIRLPGSRQSPFRRAMRSVEAFGSSLSLMNDSFIRPRQGSLSRMSMRSIESVYSGVSSKRVRSKRGSIDFNESSLPRRVNFEKKHDVSDDEDWIKSSDDQ